MTTEQDATCSKRWCLATSTAAMGWQSERWWFDLHACAKHRQEMIDLLNGELPTDPVMMVIRFPDWLPLCRPNTDVGL